MNLTVFFHEFQTITKSQNYLEYVVGIHFNDEHRDSLNGRTFSQLTLKTRQKTTDGKTHKHPLRPDHQQSTTILQKDNTA